MVSSPADATATSPEPARVRPDTGTARIIPGTLCYDCLQTRGDQIADRVRWEAELEAEFNNAQQP